MVQGNIFRGMHRWRWLFRSGGLLLAATLLLAVDQDRHGDSEVRIDHVTPMDRWIDLTWRCPQDPVTAFSIEVGNETAPAMVVQTAPAKARRASVFITEDVRKRLGSGGRFSVRITAILRQESGRVAAAPVTGTLDIVHDVERDIRQRFQYWEDRPMAYRASDPVFTETYGPGEVARQRGAAKAIWAALCHAAGATTGPREFTIPPGVYRVDPDEWQLKGTTGFTIRAPHVEIIVDGERSGSAFVFEQCAGITLSGRLPQEALGGPGLVVDSQQLPMSVARITALDAVQNTMDVEVLPGYAMDVPEQERLLAYDPQGRLINREQMGWQTRAVLGGRLLRLGTKSLRTPGNREVLIPGTLLALHNNAQHTGRTHGLFSNRRCRDMTFECVRVYNGGGAPADHGTGGATVFRDWRLMPRPGTNRLAICCGLGQFSKDGGTFVFEDCAFGPHLDDGINLLSTMSVVGQQDDRGLVIAGPQAPTVGSHLTFYEQDSWALQGEARVIESTRREDPGLLAEINDYAKSRRIVTNARNAFRVVLDPPLTPSLHAVVVHSDRRADDIIVRGCLFRDQLAQIMLLQGARHGLIENNLLLRSAGGAISAQFSQYWWEGPMPAQMMFRNNVIRDNPVAYAVNGFEGCGSIAVYAGTTVPTTARLLKDFRIEGNLIVNPAVYGIVVRNAEDVTISHNRIVHPGAKEVPGKFRGTPILQQYAAICLDAVSRAQIMDNTVVFGSSRCQRALLIEPSCDRASIVCDGNREVHEPHE